MKQYYRIFFLGQGRTSIAPAETPETLPQTTVQLCHLSQDWSIVSGHDLIRVALEQGESSVLAEVIGSTTH